MMDVWFIFNLLLPFIEVLLHTYMELLNEDDITKQSKPKETDKVVLIHLENIISVLNYLGGVKF